MTFSIAAISAAETGGVAFASVAIGAVGTYLLAPWWQFRGDRAKADETLQMTDVTIADRARADHIAAQATIITGLQSTIATMQQTAGESHRDQVEQSRKLGKLEARVAGLEHDNHELREEVTERVTERDAAVAKANALQKVIDEKAAIIADKMAEITRLLESNAALADDLSRVGTLLRASEDSNGKLKAEVERLLVELTAKQQQIAGLQQSVADLQHTLNPAVPGATIGEPK